MNFRAVRSLVLCKSDGCMFMVPSASSVHAAMEHIFWQLLDCGVEGWLVCFPPFQPHCCLLVVGPEGVASVDQLGGMCHCVLIPLHELVANDLSG